MKKILTILAAMVVTTAFLAGCGAPSPAERAQKEAVKNLAGLMATQQNPNDAETAAKVMENFAEFGANMELQQFEKLEAVDAPAAFPADTIYSKGKITRATDNSDDSYVNKSITIKTTDDLKTVKDFYKNLLAQTPWKITSQSSAGDSASFSAKDAENIILRADINSDIYSKLVTISVSYIGEITVK